MEYISKEFGNGVYKVYYYDKEKDLLDYKIIFKNDYIHDYAHVMPLEQMERKFNIDLGGELCGVYFQTERYLLCHSFESNLTIIVDIKTNTFPLKIK